jgi:hypothetical protein
MKRMKKSIKNIAKGCFAACARGPRLLIFLSEAARRATAGGLYWEFSGSSAGCYFRDDFTPLMSDNILKRNEIFRGKVSRRKNQNHKSNCTSKKGRASAIIP